jgi:hypothetical protein
VLAFFLHAPVDMSHALLLDAKFLGGMV